jgi:nitrite reductase/ring-hydroxylating ferredoxin subunit
MITQNKSVTSYRPQATGSAELDCKRGAPTESGNQRSKQLAARGLWLPAFIVLLFVHHSVNAQASFPPVSINLNYPQYQRLRLDGGYQYVDDVGMRGVIIYRLDETTYIAYERLCSFEDDAIVSVDGSGLFMKGCQSTYDFSDGSPTGGPARNRLLKYRTSLEGNKLLITDEVVF